MNRFPLALSLLCFVKAATIVRKTETIKNNWAYRGTGNCSIECDLEHFCGTDNKCHYYSCSTWYEFGPPGYTGHVNGRKVQSLDEQVIVLSDVAEEGVPQPLTCVQDTPSSDLSSTGIIFGCSSWACGGDSCSGFSKMSMMGMLGPDAGFAQDFTRACTATNGGFRFVCYDLDPSTDFSNFLSSVDSSQSISVEGMQPFECQQNGTTPQYIYQIQLQNDYGLVMNSVASDAFNKTKAWRSMHASLQKEDSGTIALVTSRISHALPLLFALTFLFI